VGVTIEPTNEVNLILNLSESHEVSGLMNSEKCITKPKVGTITVMPPGSRFEFSIHGSCQVLFLTITWDDLQHASVTVGIDPANISLLPSLNSENDRLARLLYRATNQVSEDVTNEIVKELFISHSIYGNQKRSEVYRSGGIPPARLRRIVERIEDDLASQLSLDDLAGVAGMSRFHFAREFAQSTGLPPHRYIVRKRLQRAIGLLASRRLRIVEVARLAGFSHASHLARLMLRHQGVTPDQFRKHVLL
jgi:AraC family transcriptional regulator